MSAPDAALTCTPEPRLHFGGESPRALAAAFAESDAAGLLHLATVALQDDLDPSLAWARAWGRQFLARLCQTRDAAAAEPPPAEARLALIAEAPPMRGAEYLSDALLVRLWVEMRAIVAREAAGGLEEWLRARSPLWHLVGRVTFHLAENRRNEQQPFAFLATYTDALSAAGALQHTPLGRALQAQQSRKDQAALDSLLAPVRAAAERSRLVRELLETRRLFQALAWTPQEAYAFIREIPQLEESGLVVKVPDWWKGARPARAQVTVTVDAGNAGGVGVNAMLSFNANVTLDGAKLTDAEWKLIRASPTGLVNLRGQWVEVDRERLDQVLDHFSKVQAAHATGGLSFHEGMRWLAGFPALGAGGEPALDLDTGRDWSEVVAGKNLQALLDQLREPADVEKIPGLKSTLRPYQKRGAGWLHFVARLGLGACLADDMGLGKTVQVIALLCLRRAEAKEAPPSLLVVPASLVGNWLAEFAKFAPHLCVLAAHPSVASREQLDALAADPATMLRGCDALLTTYGQLQRSEPLQAHAWDLAVLDEAQAIKNPATAQARSVKKLQARARLALTGTPVENRLGDLWSLFDFLNPGLLGTAPDFVRVTKQLSSAEHGYAPLRRLIAPYLLRRLKTDRRIIADLPEKTEVLAHCPLTKKQAVLYGRMVEQLKADLANDDLDPNVRRGLVLSYLVKFKQVCNHPSHWSGDGQWTPEESGKFARLTEIASELAERQERCLVFTQFREMTAPLAAHLAGIFGCPGLVLHGGTPVKQRPRLVEDFQRADGPPFFVLSVKAGGTGLTLTAASHVLHFDRWWNPAVENQATDRAFRIGQKKNVLVHKFVCPGTIEEKVDALIASKRALADDLLGGESGAEKMLTAMSDEELLEFVRLDVNAL
jgi:non-specific serine/threonine protein kinase